MNFFIRIGRFVNKRVDRTSLTVTRAEQLGLPKFGGDFRPHLKQDFDVYDAWMAWYMKPQDHFRVRMPTRWNVAELNGKYVPYILQIVVEKLKERNPDFKDEDISTLTLKDNVPALNDILNELAYNIYLKEHRLRYQQEQKQRYDASVSKFNGWAYHACGATFENFIRDYNAFLWKQINQSHGGYSPKIQNNYQRNFHDGEVSSVTSLIFFLYFKTNSWSRKVASVLFSSFRHPNTDHQKKLI